MRDNKDDFNDGYSTVQRFVTKLENLTKITNPTAHSLTYNATEIDVNSLELQEMLELFKKISDMVALTGIFKNWVQLVYKNWHFEKASFNLICFTYDDFRFFIKINDF